MTIQYKTYGVDSLYSLWGDFIVYRNLIPPDPRLPSISVLRSRLPLESALLPRKHESDYALVVAEQLKLARRILLPNASIQRLVFLGDTHLLDRTAFQNLCAAGNWPGWAFIGQDQVDKPKKIEVQDRVYLSNRWSGLVDFLDLLRKEDFGLDEHTALVIDMDKTAVGARGRNGQVIDEARLEGVRRTVSGLLGETFDEAAFRQVYHHLNQPAYHPFTADNQDYLAYICLVLGSGLIQFEDLLQEIQSGSLRDFHAFIARVEGNRSGLPSEGLKTIHQQVWQNVQAGDPTPFKAFRYNEYLSTAACFGGSPDEPVANLLNERITITQ